MWSLDIPKKQYTEMSFADMRAAMAKGMAEAACTVAVESVWWVTTSAPWAMSVTAASRSLPGSNQEFTQTTFISAAGFTLFMPRMKALIPCSTSGIGNAAT